MMGDAPTVTVLMPIWQAEAYLAEALDSVLAQTFDDFELLVVDFREGSVFALAITMARVDLQRPSAFRAAGLDLFEECERFVGRRRGGVERDVRAPVAVWRQTGLPAAGQGAIARHRIARNHALRRHVPEFRREAILLLCPRDLEQVERQAQFDVEADLRRQVEANIARRRPEAGGFAVGDLAIDGRAASAAGSSA